jgi:hypothetical protein
MVFGNRLQQNAFAFLFFNRQDSKEVERYTETQRASQSFSGGIALLIRPANVGINDTAMETLRCINGQWVSRGICRTTPIHRDSAHALCTGGVCA